MAVGDFRFKDGCEERATSWPKYYFVGLNGTQLHPVTIEVPKDDAACGTRDDFHGAQFRQVGTGVMSGSNTIPHQAMGVPKNIAVIKSILDSTHGTVPDVEEAAEILDGATEFSSVDMAAKTAQRLADNIKDGVGTEVWAPISPATAEYNGQNSDWRPFPLEPEGPGNYAARHCRAKPLSRLHDKKTKKEMREIRLELAPIAALEYDQRLIDALKKFAAQYPHDMLHPNLMLHACHLYADMLRAYKEEFANASISRGNKKQAQSEMPSLAECIIYLPHYFGYIKEWRALSFPSFQRFVLAMAKSDKNSSTALAVDASHIDEDNVMDWVKLTQSSCDGVSKDTRLFIRPSHLPSWPLCEVLDEDEERPTMLKMALLGLSSVYHYGLPSYKKTDQLRMELIVPNANARKVFGQRRDATRADEKRIDIGKDSGPKQMFMFPEHHNLNWQIKFATLYSLECDVQKAPPQDEDMGSDESGIRDASLSPEAPPLGASDSNLDLYGATPHPEFPETPARPNEIVFQSPPPRDNSMLWYRLNGNIHHLIETGHLKIPSGRDWELTFDFQLLIEDCPTEDEWASMDSDGKERYQVSAGLRDDNPVIMVPAGTQGQSQDRESQSNLQRPLLDREQLHGLLYLLNGLPIPLTAAHAALQQYLTTSLECLPLICRPFLDLVRCCEKETVEAQRFLLVLDRLQEDADQGNLSPDIFIWFPEACVTACTGHGIPRSGNGPIVLWAPYQRDAIASISPELQGMLNRLFSNLNYASMHYGTPTGQQLQANISATMSEIIGWVKQRINPWLFRSL